MQVPIGNDGDEAALTTAPYTGARNQTFGITTLRADPGMDSAREAPLYLVPVHAGGMALDLREGNPANGTPFQIWQRLDHNLNQLIKVSAITDTDRYRIQVKPGTLKCLGVTGTSMANGAPAESQDWSDAESQAWYVVPIAL